MTDLTARITTAMQQLTAAAGDTLLDTCRVTRPADVGQTPVLDGDGNVTGAADPVVYDNLPCLLADPKLASLRDRTLTDAAGMPDQRQLRTGHAADLKTGDQVRMLTCAFSPGLAGDTFTVVREDERSYATYRAYIVRGSTWEG